VSKWVWCLLSYFDKNAKKNIGSAIQSNIIPTLRYGKSEHTVMIAGRSLFINAFVLV
jgi:hypothetical protein